MSAPPTNTAAPPRPRGGMIEPNPNHWREASVVSALGAVTCGVGADLVGYGQWAIPGAIGLGAVSAASARYGIRNRHRDDLLARAAETLTPILGWPAPRRECLKVRRWQTGLRGAPYRFTVFYNGAGMTYAADFQSAIAESVRNLGWGYFEILRHDTRRCLIEFRRAVEPEPDPADPARERVERIVTSLFGAGGTVDEVEVNDEGTPVAFEVLHDIPHKVAVPGCRLRFERVVSATQEGRWRAKWNLKADRVRFELRPSLPASLWNPAHPVDATGDLLAEYREIEIAYGRDEDGVEHSWRPSVTPHLLSMGGTGTGKTATGHSILVDFTRHLWPVWVIDGKGVEFVPFQDWPNVQMVATTIPDQVWAIHQMKELMEYRYRLIEEGRARTEDFEPYLLFIDEFADFKVNLTDWYLTAKQKGDPNKPPVLAEIGSLARKARTARIHILLATQRPDAEILSGEVRDNFGQRLSIGKISPQGADMMWNSPAVGTTIPKGARGRGISISPAGETMEMQCYRIPTPGTAVTAEEAELLEQLRPVESIHERIVLKPASPSDETIEAAAKAAKVNLDEEPGFESEVPAGYADVIARDRFAYAKDRPDLDPVEWRRRAAEDGELDPDAGSMLTMLEGSRRCAGAAASLPATSSQKRSDPARPDLHLVHDDDGVDDFGEHDDWQGYATSVDLPAHQIGLGDLVCVDDDADTWAVVDSEPDEDFEDTDQLLVTWVDAEGTEGSLSVSRGDYLSVRHPDLSDEEMS